MTELEKKYVIACLDRAEKSVWSVPTDLKYETDGSTTAPQSWSRVADDVLIGIRTARDIIRDFPANETVVEGAMVELSKSLDAVVDKHLKTLHEGMDTLVHNHQLPIGEIVIDNRSPAAKGGNDRHRRNGGDA
tara:strand:- start:151 stop:549 length:399 start_codon:yes stop_codon:yes gene_type:complete